MFQDHIGWKQTKARRGVCTKFNQSIKVELVRCVLIREFNVEVYAILSNEIGDIDIFDQQAVRDIDPAKRNIDTQLLVGRAFVNDQVVKYRAAILYSPNQAIKHGRFLFRIELPHECASIGYLNIGYKKGQQRVYIAQVEIERKVLWIGFNHIHLQ